MERLTFREGVCPVGSWQGRSVVVGCLITWWFRDAAGKYRAIGVSVGETGATCNAGKL